MDGLDIGLEFIDELDFNPEIPCEYSWHGRFGNGEPAKFLVRIQCPREGTATVRKVMCESCYVGVGVRLYCNACHDTHSKSEVWRVVGFIGGAR